MLDVRHIVAYNRCLPVLLLVLAAALLPATARGAGQDARSLAAMLGSPDAAVRATGVSALHGCGQTVLPGLLAALDDSSAEVRRGAVIGLALQPAPGLALDGLLRALGDPDPTVRSLAAHTLARLDGLAAPDVARRLADPSNDVRVAAALCLSRMGPDAVPALARLLGRDDPPVQAKAAWLLGTMGPEALPAAPALIRALRTDDMRLVHVLAETLDLIGPDPALVFRQMTLLGSEGRNLPFSRLGAAAAPALVRLLARPGTPMGQMALYTLARMGDQAEPALRAALATGTEGQRAAAALLLTGIDPDLAHTLPEDLRRSLGGAIHLN
ncbi:PBS lyase HEAT domain protein repeat-containing protein [Pseudodesulfovibrio mercurii]|uniref:PBS lyase HEAT domain protein repeat-containing protein n=1 Tax=Pseudodesulfovibrio mercurii TaxID=641491 RepID=F0JI43_9BACT|nr:HEAT repeat domain-containing protein [Pseudodesulfovibrio mercurii]EGB15354.1 PBS lyase HEAT domain protein repeat-containing protein [Pseudodesulfovibrio mercurii]